MKQKWKDIGSPQTKLQKAYVHKIFGNMIFYRAYRRGPTHGFSNYSFHNVNIKTNNNYILKGIYPSSEGAFQSTKIPFDSSYAKKHIQSKNPRISKRMGEKIIPDKEWFDKRFEIMRYIIHIKISQHPEIKNNLLNTGLKTIIFNSKNDIFFGTGNDNKGQNKLGKILMDIRNEKFKEIFPVFKPRTIRKQILVSS